MKDKYLFTNVNIVVDSNKLILNGAIAFKDTIINIYHNLNDKILKEYEGHIFNLKGLNIMPSFVNIIDNKDSKDLAKDACFAYISNNLEYHDDKYAHFLGYHLDDIKNDQTIMIDNFDNQNQDVIKVLNHSDLYYDDLINYDFDVIYDLYHYKTGFDYLKPGVVNLAFNNRHYVILKIDDIHDEVLKFTLKTINKSKLIIINDKMSDVAKRLNDLNISFNDIVAYTSQNLYQMLKMRNYGGLIKGKSSDFIVFDDDFNIIFKIYGGKIIKCHS